MHKTRLNEHGNHSDQPTSQHFQHCEKFVEVITLHQLCNVDTDASHVNLQAHTPSG